jgi:hypothetical protein
VDDGLDVLDEARRQPGGPLEALAAVDRLHAARGLLYVRRVSGLSREAQRVRSRLL